MIKAIETKYKGYRFRSRLEARWAVFFDKLGCRWEYEPEGFDLNGVWYLPDFKVRYPSGSIHWFEVKSDVENISDDELTKIILFAKHVGNIYLLDGTPDNGSYLSFDKEYCGLIGYLVCDKKPNNILQFGFSDLFQVLDEESIKRQFDEENRKYKQWLEGINSFATEDIVSENKKYLLKNNDPRNRWGDILYTHEDGGRIYWSNWGGDVDDSFPQVNHAVNEARSARFD